MEDVGCAACHYQRALLASTHVIKAGLNQHNKCLTYLTKACWVLHGVPWQDWAVTPA